MRAIKTIIVRYNKDYKYHLHLLKSNFHSYYKADRSGHGVVAVKSVKTKSYLQSWGCEKVVIDWFDEDIRNINRIKGEIVSDIHVKDLRLEDLESGNHYIMDQVFFQPLWKHEDWKKTYRLSYSTWSNEIYTVREKREMDNPYKNYSEETFWSKKEAELAAISKIRKEINVMEEKKAKDGPGTLLSKLRVRLSELSKFSNKFEELKAKREESKDA